VLLFHLHPNDPNLEAAKHNKSYYSNHLFIESPQMAAVEMASKEQCAYCFDVLFEYFDPRFKPTPPPVPEGKLSVPFCLSTCLLADT